MLLVEFLVEVVDRLLLSVGLRRRFREEFEGDVGHDALQAPARALVQGLDLVDPVHLGFELGTKVGFQDAAEEVHPWGDFARLQKVGAHSNLVAHVENLANDDHNRHIVLTLLQLVIGQDLTLNNREENLNQLLEWLAIRINLILIRFHE